MHKIASPIRQKANEVAEEIIKTGKTILPIKKSFFLSTDIEEVFALDIIVLNGKTFFIGPKRENK